MSSTILDRPSVGDGIIRGESGKVVSFATAAPTQPVTAADIVGPMRSGSFVPEDITGLQGDFFSSVEQSWSDGLLGYLTRPEEVNIRERDRLSAQAENYAKRHGVKAFIGGVIGGTASDAPIDIALILAGGPVLGAAAKASKAVGAVKAASRLDNARSVARKFAAGDSINFKQRMAYEGAIGALAGMGSVGAQSALGRDFTAKEAVNRVIEDAVGSAVFSEAIRGGIKLFGWSKRKAEVEVKKAIEESTDTNLKPETEKIDEPELTAEQQATEAANVGDFLQQSRQSRADVDAEIDRANLADTEVRQRQAQQDISLRGEEAAALNIGAAPRAERIDVDDVVFADDIAVANARVADKLNEVEGSPQFRSAIDQFNKKKNRESLEGAVSLMLPKRERHLAGALADFMEAKAKAGGQTLGEYVTAKGLNFKSADKISAEFDGMKSTINAVENATSMGEFIHELGHVYRADLSDAHVSSIEKAYGIEDGVWSRELEENFANDFTQWVSEGKSSKLPRPIRRAFDALSKWLKNTIGALLNIGVDTSKVSPEVTKVFEGMFKTDIENAPSALKEFMTFTQRQEEGTLELAATKRGEESSIPKDVQERQIRNKDIVKSADVEDSILTPKTSKAKKFMEAIKKLPKLAGFQNMSMLGLVDGLGRNVSAKVRPMLDRGLNLSSKLRNEMNTDLKKLNVSDSFIFDKTEKAIDLGKDQNSVSMTADERRSLYMRLLHGLDKDLKVLPRVDTAFRRIVRMPDAKGVMSSPSGVEIGGKDYTLSFEDAMDLIKSNKLVSPEEKKVIGGLFNIYQKIVPQANKISKDLTGKKIFSSQDVHYNPLVSRNDPDDIEMLSLDKMLGKKEDQEFAIEGALKRRANKGVVLLENPFVAMNRYIQNVPEALAYAEPAKIIGEIVRDNRTSLTKAYGRSYVDSLDTLTRNLVGDRSKLNRGMGQIGSYVVKIANLSKLSLNFGTALKQIASVGSAQASRVITFKTKDVVADAVYLAKNSSERQKLIEEAKAASPFFRSRQETGVAFLDDDLLSSVEFSMLMRTRENAPSAKELLKLALDSKIKRTEAWAETVSKGLFMIKHVDEATMAALWRAAKESPEALKTSPAKLFNDIIIKSQPSYDKLSRSLNQTNRDMLSRSLAAFSTQTRKNAELAFNATYARFNGNMGKDEYFKIMAPLAGQTAYASLAGATSTIATAYAIDTISDKKQPELEKKMDERALDLTRRFFADALGQIPVTGAMATYALQKFSGGYAFGQDIIGIEEYEEMVDAFAKGDPSKIARASGNLLGSSTLGKVVASQF